MKCAGGREGGRRQGGRGRGAISGVGTISTDEQSQVEGSDDRWRVTTEGGGGVEL